MDIKTTLKATVAAGALVAVAAPMGVAEAGSLSAANSKVDVTVGGRVHRALVYVDDGHHSELFHTPGITSNSEMWLAGKGKLTESVTMGGYLRWDITKEDGTWGFGSTTGDATVGLSENTGTQKYEYIYWQHKTMGTLSMGGMEPAADGTMDKRYAPTVMNQASAAAGNTQFTTGANGAFSGNTAGVYFIKVDPGDTSPKLRYDSAPFNGFTVHGDYRQDGGGSVALKYSGKIAGLDMFAGIGYDNTGAGTEMKGGSIGFKHSSGFNIAGNYGDRDNAGATTDPTWWRVIGGYDAKLNSLGTTKFVIGYSEAEDVTTIGNEGTAFRVGVHQSLDAVGARLALEYVNLEASDTAGTDLKDIDIVLFETNFNF